MQPIVSLDSIINSLEETIILCDKKTKIVFVNKTGEELLRKSSKDIVGKRMSRIIAGKASVSPLIKKVINEGMSYRGKAVTMNIGEKLINVDFTLSPFFMNGKNKGAILSLSENINISEREDDNFDSIDYLLGTIAHEIKNPLGGIKGAAQLMRNNTQNVCIDEYVDLIIRETDRLNAILQDYLSAGKKPSFNPVNIHEVLEQALAINNITLKKTGITLKRLYDPSLPKVRGDEGKLLQVFINIIKNAVESMKKGGSLEISTYPSKELFGEHGKSRRMASVSVKDTGRGIPENETQKIFIPFYSRKKRGAGIGLAISKKIIKDHGGFIKVSSQKNKGSCFQIFIPFIYNG